MGFAVKFNWVLQHTPPDSIRAGESHAFTKSGNRVFPIGTPIDLIDEQRNAIAKIEIIEFANTAQGTRGEYTILKPYTGEEKATLTRYWIENQA